MTDYTGNELIVRFDNSKTAFEDVADDYKGRLVFIAGKDINTYPNATIEERKQYIWLSDEGENGRYIGFEYIDRIQGFLVDGKNVSASGAAKIGLNSGRDVVLAYDSTNQAITFDLKNETKQSIIIATQTIDSLRTEVNGIQTDVGNIEGVLKNVPTTEAMGEAIEASLTDAKNYATAQASAAKVEAIESSKVTVEKATGTGDIATSYTIKQGGEAVGTIDIAKQMVIESGSIVEGTWANGVFTEMAGGTDKAIKLVLAGQDKALYINVADLIDAYTPASNATEVQLSITADNVISASLVVEGVTTDKIADGAVNADKLATNLKNAIASANSAVQDVTGGTTTNDYIEITTNKTGNNRTIGVNAKTAEIGSEAGETKGLATVEDVRAYLKSRLSVRIVS